MSGLGPNRRLVSHRIFALLLLAGAIAGVLARPAVAAQPPASLTAWIAADFDGDRKPDLAHAGSFHSDGRGIMPLLPVSIIRAPSRAGGDTVT